MFLKKNCTRYLLGKSSVEKLFFDLYLIFQSTSDLCHLLYMLLAILLMWISCSYPSCIFLLSCLTFHHRFEVVLTIQWITIALLLHVLHDRFEENYLSVYAWLNNIIYYGTLLVLWSIIENLYRKLCGKFLLWFPKYPSFKVKNNKFMP